ncbi:MAG: hypothetical protein WBQ84_00500 [Methylocella sp.]
MFNLQPPRHISTLPTPVPGDGHNRARALGAFTGQTELGKAADFDI